MKHMLLVGMIGVVSAAFGYSGLETSLKELAVRLCSASSSAARRIDPAANFGYCRNRFLCPVQLRRQGLG